MPLAIVDGQGHGEHAATGIDEPEAAKGESEELLGTKLSTMDRKRTYSFSTAGQGSASLRLGRKGEDGEEDEAGGADEGGDAVAGGPRSSSRGGDDGARAKYKYRYMWCSRDLTGLVWGPSPYQPAEGMMPLVAGAVSVDVEALDRPEQAASVTFRTPAAPHGSTQKLGKAPTKKEARSGTGGGELVADVDDEVGVGEGKGKHDWTVQWLEEGQMRTVQWLGSNEGATKAATFEEEVRTGSSARIEAAAPQFGFSLGIKGDGERLRDWLHALQWLVELLQVCANLRDPNRRSLSLMNRIFLQTHEVDMLVPTVTLAKAAAEAATAVGGSRMAYSAGGQQLYSSHTGIGSPARSQFSTAAAAAVSSSPTVAEALAASFILSEDQSPAMPGSGSMLSRRALELRQDPTDGAPPGAGGAMPDVFRGSLADSLARASVGADGGEAMHVGAFMQKQQEQEQEDRGRGLWAEGSTAGAGPLHIDELSSAAGAAAYADGQQHLAAGAEEKLPVPIHFQLTSAAWLRKGKLYAIINVLENTNAANEEEPAAWRCVRSTTSSLAECKKLQSSSGSGTECAWTDEEEMINGLSGDELLSVTVMVKNTFQSNDCLGQALLHLDGIDTEYPQQCILTLKDLELPVFDSDGAQMMLTMGRSDKRMLEVRVCACGDVCVWRCARVEMCACGDVTQI
jgi:hypothetical protein